MKCAKRFSKASGQRLRMETDLNVNIQPASKSRQDEHMGRMGAVENW